MSGPFTPGQRVAWFAAEGPRSGSVWEQGPQLHTAWVLPDGAEEHPVLVGWRSGNVTLLPLPDAEWVHLATRIANRLNNMPLSALTMSQPIPRVWVLHADPGCHLVADWPQRPVTGRDRLRTIHTTLNINRWGALCPCVQALARSVH